MSVVPIKIPMTAKRAEDLVKQIAADSSDVRFSRHAEERMEEREISFADVLRVLKNGYVEGQPVATNHPDEWKCKVVRHSRGNREIGAVVIIIKEKTLFIKTVEWEDL